MGRTLIRERDPQATLDGNFRPARSGTTILLTGRGRHYEAFKQKFKDLQKEQPNLEITEEET
ncbi:MAG: hypothetical protein QMD46_12675 [Methanomicrobiales archaeon]|nr:hypothetical protein [Methanomicrobiales archaeon]